MLKGGELDLNIMQRCSYDSKDVLKRMMLQHEAIFRDQVYELHRLYNTQQRLMNELAWESSGKWRKDPYADLISSQRAINFIPRFCSSTASSTLAEHNYLEEPSKDADYNLNRPINLDLQLPSDMYISDAGSQSASNCFDIKDCSSGNKNTCPDELNISTSTKNDLVQKGGSGRIMFCEVIDLECPAEGVPLEEAKGSSSIDESQTIYAKSDCRAQSQPVLGSSISKTAKSWEGQGLSTFDAGHNAGLVGYTTLDQSCVPFKAMPIDLNAPQIDESPSIFQDPALFPTAAASSSCVLDGPIESITALASVGSTKIPTISRSSDREEVYPKVFGSVLLLPQQEPSSCNKLDKGMKLIESSSLSSTGLCKLPSQILDPPLGSLTGSNQDKIKSLMANPDYKWENFHLKASLLSSSLLPIAGGEGHEEAATEEKCEEDTISSNGYGDIVESDKVGAVLQDYDEIFGSSKDKLCIVQDSELPREDKCIREDPSRLEEFQVTRLEPFVAINSTEKLDIAQKQTCLHLQERHGSYSKACCGGNNVEWQQKDGAMDITTQSAAEALIDISREKPDVFQVRCISSPTEKMNEESDYPSDSYVSLVLQLPEIDSEECSSWPQPDEKETGGKTSRLKLRRGRRLLDFQKDVLPGLLSLSRHEICEDIHMIGELIRCTEAKTNGSRRGNWFVPTRSRRSRHY